ncbi:hypothetical protein OIU77_021985, partial [Salix suchowensis]
MVLGERRETSMVTRRRRRRRRRDAVRLGLFRLEYGCAGDDLCVAAGWSAFLVKMV